MALFFLRKFEPVQTSLSRNQVRLWGELATYETVQSPLRGNKTPHTLSVCYENSIYIAPSLGHNGCWVGAQKSRTVKRNDTGLHPSAQSGITNITL
jgi:hypothetical protein